MKGRKNKNKYFTFRNHEGIEYTVFFRKPDPRTNGEADGLCLNPLEKTPKVYINPHLTQQSELNTCIHEVCHAYFWDESEAKVTKCANTLSRLLFNKCGWRKTK